MLKYSSIFFSICLFIACNEAEIIAPTVYDCTLSFSDESASHPNHLEFQAALEEVTLFTPGVQVSITTKDGKKWTGAAGMADIPNNIPFQPCHKSMVGSISKMYTAVLIMQLQEEGILSVDDLLSKWLEADLINQIENADVVTIRQLLNHTSGIRDYLALKQFVDAHNTPNFTLTQREKLEYIYGKKADHAPDAAHTYSNSNYVLLGLVIENARNMRLWEAVETYITQPMGYQNTIMGTETNPIPVGTARPYLATNGQRYFDIMSNAVSDAATGDGGIAANTQELNAFVEALFDGSLVSNTTLTEMLANPEDVDGYSYRGWEEEFYGLGVESYESPYGTAFGHTGSTSAYNAYLLHFPNQQVTLSIMYNGASNVDEVGTKKSEMREKLLEIIFK